MDPQKKKIRKKNTSAGSVFGSGWNASGFFRLSRLSLVKFAFFVFHFVFAFCFFSLVIFNFLLGEHYGG